MTLFCGNSNNCEPGAHHQPNAPDLQNEPAGPCAHTDSQGRFRLKPSCPLTCRELVRFDPGYAYQDDGASFPPRCDPSGLPSNAFVIDDVTDGTASIRPN